MPHLGELNATFSFSNAIFVHSVQNFSFSNAIFVHSVQNVT